MRRTSSMHVVITIQRFWNVHYVKFVYGRRVGRYCEVHHGGYP